LGGYNGDLRAASSGKAAVLNLLLKTSVRWRCQIVESSTESRDTGGGDTQSTADQYKEHVRTVETRLCEVQECGLWRHNLIFMFVVRYVSVLIEKGANFVNWSAHLYQNSCVNDEGVLCKTRRLSSGRMSSCNILQISKVVYRLHGTDSERRKISSKCITIERAYGLRGGDIT
jgi:hypothetical protein